MNSLNRHNRSYSRRIEDTHDLSGAWIISFTDLTALLLTFFLLLFAMSHPKEGVWEGFTQNVQNNFNSQYGKPINRGNQDTISIDRINFSQALDLDYLRSIMESLLEQQEVLSSITISERPDALVLTVPEALLFSPEQADIKEEGRKILYAMAPALRRIKNRLEIAGSAKDAISSPTFASAWELSLAQAGAVSGVLQAAGYDRPVVIRSEALASGAKSGLHIIIMEDDGKRVTLFDIGAP